MRIQPRALEVDMPGWRLALEQAILSWLQLTAEFVGQLFMEVLKLLTQPLLHEAEPLLCKSVQTGVVRELLRDLLAGVKVVPQTILQQQEIERHYLLTAIKEGTGLQ